jgi:hypothetical protein
MKIETNIVGFTKRKRTEVLLAVVLGVILLLGAGVFALLQQNEEIIRDFQLAQFAYENAGEVIPLEPEGYAGDNYLPSALTWGIKSNSIWASQYARRIVPFFSYEKATFKGVYPEILGVIPFVDYENFHIAGRMIPTQGRIALLNERFFFDPNWSDERRALEVLVHELVHVQGGNYIEGSSESLESKTSIVTIEVMAAMCNYGDPVACDAFYLEIHHLARTALHIRLAEKGYGHVYEWIANTLWRDEVEQAKYEKAMRFWSEDMDGLMTIRKKYSLIPYEYMLEAIQDTDIILLDTGHKNCSVLFCSIIGMPMDDTAALLEGFVGRK